MCSFKFLCRCLNFYLIAVYLHDIFRFPLLFVVANLIFPVFCQSLRLTVGLLTVQPFQFVLSLCQTWGLLSAVLFIFSVWFCNLMPFCIVECALCQEFVENMSVRFCFIITGYLSKTTGIWFTKKKKKKKF